MEIAMDTVMEIAMVIVMEIAMDIAMGTAMEVLLLVILTITIMFIANDPMSALIIESIRLNMFSQISRNHFLAMSMKTKTRAKTDQ